MVKRIGLEEVPRSLGEQMQVVNNLRKSGRNAGSIHKSREIGLEKAYDFLGQVDEYWKTVEGKPFEKIAWTHYLKPFVQTIIDYREGQRPQGVDEVSLKKYLHTVAIFGATDRLLWFANNKKLPEGLHRAVTSLIGKMRARTLLPPGAAGIPIPWLTDPNVPPERRLRTDEQYYENVTDHWENVVASVEQWTGEKVYPDRILRDGVRVDPRQVHTASKHLSEYQNMMSYPHSILWEDAFAREVPSEGYRLTIEIDNLSYVLDRLHRELTIGTKPSLLRQRSGPLTLLPGALMRKADGTEAEDALEALHNVGNLWTAMNRSVVRGYWTQLYDQFTDKTEAISASAVDSFITGTLRLLPSPVDRSEHFVRLGLLEEEKR